MIGCLHTIQFNVTVNSSIFEKYENICILTLNGIVTCQQIASIQTFIMATKNKAHTSAPNKNSTDRMDLSMKKLPTETAQMKAKKSKYADKYIFPNCKGPSRILFSGPSGSGKTNTSISLLTDPRMMRGFFEKIVIFCPSAGVQEDYDHLRRCYPDEDQLEISDFSPALVDEKVNEIKKIVETCKQFEAPLPQILFLFDDCVNLPGFDKISGTLAIKCRQWAISMWILTQSLMDVTRLMRLQASNIFAFSPTESEVERLAADATNVVANKDLVATMIRQATSKRYRAFHLHRHAPPHLQYRTGLTEFFKLRDPTIEEGEETTDNIHTEEKDEDDSSIQST